MKPSINIISNFSRIKDEVGNDHFTGTIDVAALKKTKESEIEVVLVPIESVPKTLAGLMSRNSVTKDGLIMFAGASASEEDNRKKGQGK